MRKRSIVALLVLGALIAAILLTSYGLTRRVHAMTVRFNIRDIKEHGLEIMGPLDPSFDSLASTYFKGRQSSKLAAFKPFSVFLKNQGSKALVAYVLKWEVVGPDGTVSTNFNSYAQTGVLMGYGVGIRTTPGTRQIIDPGSVRLFSSASPIDVDEGNSIGSTGYYATSNDAASFDPSSKVADRIKSQLRQCTSITVSLDGAFFADGTFVGSNSSGYFERIKAEIDAKRDMLELIENACNKPADLDRVFETIQAKSNIESLPPSLDSSAEALYEYHAQLFAREIVGLKDSYGQERTTDHLRALYHMRKPTITKLER